MPLHARHITATRKGATSLVVMFVTHLSRPFDPTHSSGRDSCLRSSVYGLPFPARHTARQNTPPQTATYNGTHTRLKMPDAIDLHLFLAPE